MSITKRVLGQAAYSVSSSHRSFENFEDDITDDALTLAQHLQIEQQAAMEELNSIGTEIVEEMHEGELLAEAIDTYPQVVEMIEEDIDNNGGVSVESAKYLNFILQRAGLGDIISVSVEDFANNQRRLNATTVSLEGIKETLRNWWDNLLRLFKRMRENMKKWWIKHFSAASALKRRAENIADRAKKITTSNPKLKSLSFARLQSSLYVSGRYPGVNLPSELKKMTAVGQTLFSDWQQEGIRSAEAILDVVGSADLTGEGITTFATGLQAVIESGLSFSPTGFSAAVGEDIPDTYVKHNDARFVVTRSPELPGQKAIYLKQMGNNMNRGGDGTGLDKLKKSVDWLSTRSFKLDHYTKKPRPDTETTIDTLTPTLIVEVCAEVEAMASIIENYQRNFKAQEAANNHIEKFKKIASQSPDDSDRDAIKAQNLVKRIPNPLRDMINEPISQFGEHFMRTANVALQVCERSLSQY